MDNYLSTATPNIKRITHKKFKINGKSFDNDDLSFQLKSLLPDEVLLNTTFIGQNYGCYFVIIEDYVSNINNNKIYKGIQKIEKYGSTEFIVGNDKNYKFVSREINSKK